jgi:hypothetical protein
LRCWLKFDSWVFLYWKGRFFFLCVLIFVYVSSIFNISTLKQFKNIRIINLKYFFYFIKNMVQKKKKQARPNNHALRWRRASSNDDHIYCKSSARFGSFFFSKYHSKKGFENQLNWRTNFGKISIECNSNFFKTYSFF